MSTGGSKAVMSLKPAMTSDKALKQALRPFRLVASSYRNRIAKVTRSWVENSGFYWTKGRFDSLIQYCFKLRAGQPTLKPTWFRKDLIAYLERVSQTGPDEQFVELVQVLRVYTRLGDQVTEVRSQDYEKFVQAVEGPVQGSGWRIEPSARGMVCDLGELEVDKFFKDVFRAGPLKGTQATYTSPLPLGDEAWMNEVLRKWASPTRHVPSPNLLGLDGEEFEQMVAGMNHVPEVLTDVSSRRRISQNGNRGTFLPLDTIYRLNQVMLTQHRPDGTCGQVCHRIQNDGKVRFYFAPHLWVQYFMAPYAKELYGKLRRVKRDYTFDQDAGVRYVQEMIRAGKRCHSIDLSSATDRFPAAFTYRCLTALYPSKNGRWWAERFAQISRLPAGITDPVTQKRRLIRWRVGQPLGTNVSFAAFALSHHCLVALIADALNKHHFEDYAILGDDIVIADDEVADAYRNFMKRFGVSTAEHKSVTSDSFGEFGGRMILPEYMGFKLKYSYSDYRTLNSQIDLLGAKAIRMHSQSALRDVLALLPIGNSPGFNPGGFPRAQVDAFLADYFSQPEDLTLELDKDYTVPDHVVVTRARVMNALHRCGTTYPLSHAPTGARRLDRYGSPEPGPQRGTQKDNQFRKSMFASRSWLSKVKRMAFDAGLITSWSPKGYKKRT